MPLRPATWLALLFISFLTVDGQIVCTVLNTRFHCRLHKILTPYVGISCQEMSSSAVRGEETRDESDLSSRPLLRQQALRHYATSREGAGSILDEVKLFCRLVFETALYPWGEHIP
jgi:hypothetical protein